MQKILSKLIPVLLIAMVILPLTVSAQALPTEGVTSCRVKADLGGWQSCPVEGADCAVDSTTSPCLLCCTISWVVYIADIVFFVVMILAVLFIILAGYNFLMSQGDPAKVATARNMIIYAIVGIIVAVLAKAVPAMVKALV